TSETRATSQPLVASAWRSIGNERLLRKPSKPLRVAGGHQERVLDLKGSPAVLEVERFEVDQHSLFEHEVVVTFPLFKPNRMNKSRETGAGNLAKYGRGFTRELLGTHAGPNHWIHVGVRRLQLSVIRLELVGWLSDNRRPTPVGPVAAEPARGV